MRKIPLLCFFATVGLVCFSTLSDDRSNSTPAIGSTHGVNLSDLRDLSYRIDWVNQQTAKDLRLATLSDDTLYAIDEYEHLVCYDLDSGAWRWSSPVGNHVYRLLGINTNEKSRQVYVNSDAVIYTFESDTGNLPTHTSNPIQGATDKAVQKLQWSANTSAIITGTTLLYGSRNGELVWHDCGIGFSSRTYSIADTMSTTPALSNGIIVATGGNGALAAIDLKTARAHWMIQLLDAVVATPTISNGTVYIAGTDQYLRAIDLHTGRPRWKYLTTAELTDSPVIVGDALYQRIPGVGLSSFSAFAPDITGEKRWTAEKVRGTVITTTPNNRLLCWDTQNRILQEVDTKHGSITGTMPLPTVREVLVDDDKNGNLILITDDDAIIKLIPRLSQN
ncbi:MAG: PQQ-like beta-propeller repeat protein [Planctomycetes bacterium]|nr:PQQ-like beta-propeller repeat protein [Planctomycetota bacterium]